MRDFVKDERLIKSMVRLLRKDHEKTGSGHLGSFLIRRKFRFVGVWIKRREEVN